MERIYSGKVREIYDISDKYLVIVTTDRISAFDHILPVLIKDKGVVLNKLSNFWFKKTSDIVSNHIIDDRVENMPSFFQNDFCRERTVMVKKLNMLPHDIGHDEYVSIEEVESRIGAEMTKQITEICFKLYEECSEYAFSKGLIIADAKFEFGQNGQGELVLADEIFTPDSSRYWDAGSYKVGVSPDSFDKQFLRDWLLNNKVNGEFQFDKVP